MSRNETSGAWVKSGGKFWGEPLLAPSAMKTMNKASVPKGGPVLEGRAEPDAAIVQRGEQCGEAEADDEVRKINRASGDAVDLDRIERGDDVAGDAADGNGFPGADDEIGEHHHPSGGEADGAGECGGGVGDFAGGVRHRGHQPAVDPADGEQQCATDGEAEKCAQRAAAQQPVVHDDEPADADHGAPGQVK